MSEPSINSAERLAAVELEFQKNAEKTDLNGIELSRANLNQYVRDLEKKKVEELAAFLSDDELREYKYRNSMLSRLLAKQVGMDLTEAEFRQVYDSSVIREQMMADYGSGAITRSEYDELNGRALEDLERALGPERYAEYQLSLNPGYTEIQGIVSSQQLAPDTMNRFFDLVTQARTGAMNARFQDRDAVVRETRRQLRSMIGDRGVDTLISSGADIKAFGYSIAESPE